MAGQSFLHACLRPLLRGVVRFCLTHAIRLQECIEVLKQVFVEVCIEELEKVTAQPTVARISVMSGVHRKDVQRLINNSSTQTPTTASLVTRIIGQWQGDKKFQNKIKQPRTLSYEGSSSDFSTLVRTVSRELNPSIVLEELERVGAVKKEALGLKLTKNTYVPTDGDVAEGFGMLSEDCEDLIACVETNLLPKNNQKNLHIKTEYDAIPDSLVSEVRQWLLKEGTAFHKSVARYLSSKDKDLNPSLKKLPGKNRVALGSFSVSQALSSEDS